jgi:hypothetical protein
MRREGLEIPMKNMTRTGAGNWPEGWNIGRFGKKHAERCRAGIHQRDFLPYTAAGSFAEKPIRRRVGAGGGSKSGRILA